MNSKFKNKKYILWDHDGVLVDTEEWYYKAIIMALKEIGISLSKQEYMDYMQTGITVWTMLKEKGIKEDIIKQQRDKRNYYYQQFLLHENIDVPNVTAVLEKLKKNFSMAIVTTSKKCDFQLIHKNRNILNYMDFYLTVDDYKQAKPMPDPYLTAMKKFSATKDECIVIEDSARGLKSAIAAGIDCIIVRHPFTKSHNFTGATYFIDSIEELPKILI